MPNVPNILRYWDPEVGTRSITMNTPNAGAVAFPGVPAGQPVLESMDGVVSSDPGSNQDSTQGYVVGSVVFNNTAGQLRFWVCRDATAGAAKWAFEGADFANGGTNPNTEQTQAGLSTASIAAEGNINRQVTATPGINPAGNGGDFVLAIYALPANLFDQSGRGITITAQGSFGGTGNTKRCKIYFNATGTGAVVGGSIGAANGTVIADTGAVSTNGLGWSIQANVFKYGAAGSNTQLGIHQQAQIGGTVANLLAPQNLTATESGAITIAVTGNPTTLANDIALNFMETNMMN